MSDKIKLVQGDSRPNINVALTDSSTGAVIDLTATTVVMFFRKVGETAILDTLTGTLTSPSGGLVSFAWHANTLATAEGEYEGEIQITFVDSTIQTVYTKLKFTVRADF